jgi:hypothetical protein
MNGIMSDKKQYADKMTVFLFSYQRPAEFVIRQ